MTEDIDIDIIIKRLWASRNNKSGRKILTESEIRYICAKSIRAFKKQPVFLELIPPLTICGDIHGQFTDLLNIFDKCGSPDIKNYLFLGDYVDRGQYSINTISLLLAYKIKYPNNFFMLRGNHEATQVNYTYGFRDECCKLYDESIWVKFNQVFDWMPISALINKRILCIHGGISPDLNSLDDLKRIQRPTDVPNEGLLCDLLWSDPSPFKKGWGESERGISQVFGSDSIKKVLANLNLELVIRAHQCVHTGYEFPFKPNQSVLTIFSAPNYEGLGNEAAIIHISKKMVCTFTVIRPINNK